MNTNGSHPRRRRAGVIAAVCGGGAASTIGLSQHLARGPQGIVWQDIGLAVAIVLIVVAIVACVVATRGGRA